MFYLETKDGDKFLTDPTSDDKVEFWKILDQKLGRQTADMFDEFIKDTEYIINPDKVEQASCDIDDIINILNNIISSDIIQKSDISKCIDRLKQISNNLEKLI